MDAEAILEQLPKILKEKPGLRYEIALILSEHVPLREEMLRILEEIKKLREDFNKEAALTHEILEKHAEEIALTHKRLEEHAQEIRKLREDFNKMFEEQVRLREEQARFRSDLERGFASIHRLITSLGRRWGLMSEEAFRRAMKQLLSEYFKGRVSRWSEYDEEGIVHGYPEMVEVDLVIEEDGKHVLVEVKSHVDKAEVYKLLRTAKFYEKKTGVKPARLVFVTPYIDEDAYEKCMMRGIEVYTSV